MMEEIIKHLPKLVRGQKVWLCASDYVSEYTKAYYFAFVSKEEHWCFVEVERDESGNDLPYNFKDSLNKNDNDKYIALSAASLLKRPLYLKESDHLLTVLVKRQEELHRIKVKLADAYLAETKPVVVASPPKPPVPVPIARTPWKQKRIQESKELLLQVLKAPSLESIAQQEKVTAAAIRLRINSALRFMQTHDPAWHDVPKAMGIRILRKSKNDFIKRLTV